MEKHYEKQTKKHMKTKDSTEKQNLGWSTAHVVHI